MVLFCLPILAMKNRYPDRRSATLPALYAAQDEQRWLSSETIDGVADLQQMSVRMVHEVATFYVMFETKHVGTHLVEVCDNISCALRGGEDILQYLDRKCYWENLTFAELDKRLAALTDDRHHTKGDLVEPPIPAGKS